MVDQALSDVRILDLAYDIAGPFCTRLFADYGAEVVKIENPAGGDPVRQKGRLPNDVPHPEKSGVFLHLNMNKKSITLDLSTLSGQSILKRLVKDTDIVVENYPPGSLDSWGLSYNELARINPRLVATSITPFGQYGPYRDYKAQELSSRMLHHGRADKEPLRYAPDIGWFQTGSTAASATMGALTGSRMYGFGQHAEVSAMEAVIGKVDIRLLVYECTKQPGPRERLAMGREDTVRHPLAGPLLRSGSSVRTSSRPSSFPGSLN